jgi:predicted ester cyclase
MPAQQTQQTPEVVEYERKWVEALNRGDTSVADETFAPDCVIHITGSPVPDLDVAGFKQMLAGFFAAFPDIRFTIEDQIVAGDKVAFRWVAEGTHTGPLGAATPTGRRMRIDGLLFDRIAAGRVVERWEQWDQPAMLRQLGFA